MPFEPPPRFAAETIPFSDDTFKGAIPARFEEIVRRLPDHVAIKTGQVVGSFAQLNSVVNRLARTIVERRGSAPEAVGILVDRGSAPAAAMLAVLKAGKYFVPLDPSFPKARLGTTLQQAQAKLLITDRHNIALGRAHATEVDPTAGR